MKPSLENDTRKARTPAGIDRAAFDRAPFKRTAVGTSTGPWLILGVLFFASTLLMPTHSFAATSASGSSVDEGRATFDHSPWTKILERFVDERGRVDYRALSKDRADFDRYLHSLATSGPKTTPELFPNRDHRLAYYLNAYNALVFDGVLARGPETESVWKGGLISGYGFFVKQKFTLDGEKISLKKLEDDVVRKEFGDPRIHAALNCASLGCPRLPRKAFEGETLDRELDREMRYFVSESRNVRVDESNRRVFLSQIFDWFEKDFLDWERRQGASRPSLIDYVNRYRADGAKLPTDYRVSFIDYDKSINQQ